MAAEVPLSNSKVVLIVIAILVIIFVVNFVISPTFEQIECEEKGGKWASVLGGGCGMTTEACEDAGGISTGYLPCNNILGCVEIAITGCDFREFIHESP